MNELTFSEWLKKYGINPLHAAYPDIGGYDYARAYADGVEPMDARQSAFESALRNASAQSPTNAPATPADVGRYSSAVSAMRGAAPRFVWPDAYRVK